MMAGHFITAADRARVRSNVTDPTTGSWNEPAALGSTGDQDSAGERHADGRGHRRGVGKSLRSRGYQDKVRGYRRETIGARVPGFITLPPEALVFGYVNVTGRGAGRPRYELAVLARMGWLWRRSKGVRSAMCFGDGVEIEVAEDEFVASIQGVTECIWEGLLGRRMPEAGHEDLEFARFYKRIQYAVERIEATEVAGHPLLRRLGPARTDVPGKAQDLYGLRWTMAGSVVDAGLDRVRSCDVPLIIVPAPPSFPGTTYVEEPAGSVGTSDTPTVDVIARYAPLVLEREDLVPVYTQAAVRIGGYERKEQARTFWTWQCRRSARRWEEPAHVSVGAWQVGDALAEDRGERPCTVPYLVAEIDGEDAEASQLCARLLIDRLEEVGVRLADVVVAYSGRRSFHVRIPHMLVGQPVYAKAAEVASLLAAFFQTLTRGIEGPAGPLFSCLDSNLFSPLHHIRAVGSRHEGRPDHSCVAFRGDEFLGLDLDTVEQYSYVYSPFRMPNPDKGEPVPELVRMLQDAVQSRRRRHRPRGHNYAEDRGIISRIREGVAPGEEFGVGHAGRNKAAFIYALYLLTSGGLGEGDAWEELGRWNEEANPVALDARAELRHVFRSACRASRRPRKAATMR